MTQQWQADAVAADYENLLKIANGILRHPGKAEEVVHECLVSALDQIAAGKVKAQTEAQFYAWLHVIVRRGAMRRAGVQGGDGDIQPTPGDRNLRRKVAGVDTMQLASIDAFADHARQVGRSKFCHQSD